MARLLVGVSGGIAAYKALELVRAATQAGHAVRVIQTPTSQRFVGAASFAALSGAPVLTDEFERDPARGAFPDQLAPSHEPFSHLELVRNADLMLIAPATANTIARLAHGIADNLLCTAALAARCPLVLAPAMNNHMYEHPATQANLQLLRARGAHVIEPGEGALASAGEWGVGRLAEPAQLLAACQRVLERAGGSGAAVPQPARSDWEALRVLVTAGGTREPIDSVRYVGNRSSGRMGFALASACADRGAQVTVVAANVSLPRDPRVDYLEVTTASQLQSACAEAFDACDVLLMAAAVADFRPAEPLAGKLDRRRQRRVSLELEATSDVLANLASRRHPGQTLVGFAAEHGADALPRARAKLAAKGLDAVVLNDISDPRIGFDSAQNEVRIVTADSVQDVPCAAKSQVAAAILDAVGLLRQGAPSPAG